MGFVRIRTVAALDGRRVRLGLTDGSERVVDLRLLLVGPIFEPVRADDRLRAEVLAVVPMDRARRGAGRAQDALRRVVVAFAVFL